MYLTPTAIEFAKNFDGKHESVDNPSVLDRRAMRRLYADGAWRDDHPCGVASEPATEPLIRARQILVYWSLRLKQAVDAFDHRKSQLLAIAQARQNGHIIAQDTEEAAAELQALKAKVEAARTGLAAAQERFDDLDPRSPKRAMPLTDDLGAAICDIKL